MLFLINSTPEVMWKTSAQPYNKHVCKYTSVQFQPVGSSLFLQKNSHPRRTEKKRQNWICCLSPAFRHLIRYPDELSWEHTRTFHLKRLSSLDSAHWKILLAWITTVIFSVSSNTLRSQLSFLKHSPFNNDMIKVQRMTWIRYFLCLWTRRICLRIEISSPKCDNSTYTLFIYENMHCKVSLLHLNF